MDINQLKSLLGRYHIHLNKLMGQNFLLSEKVLDEIVASSELTGEDTVLEIGPGLGSLTAKLAAKAGKVVAIEKDRSLVRALKKFFKNAENVKIIQGDALDLKSAEIQMPNGKFKVVANIPYYLTGKIIRDFLTASNKPALMVLLLQEEVALRVTAAPGSMSLLTLNAQFYSVPEIIAKVDRENFYPIPEVDSAVVRFRVLASPFLKVDEKKFFQLAKIGFSNRRKQLHNNLAGGFGPRDFKKVLEEIGLNPLSRAQDLSLQDWGRLYDSLVGTKTA